MPTGQLHTSIRLLCSEEKMLEHANLGPVVSLVGQVNQNVLTANQNVVQTAEMVQAVGLQVSQLSGEQQHTHQRLEELIQSFAGFLSYDYRSKIVADAKQDLQRLTAEFDVKFGHYRRTRRMATGLVNALALGTVDQQLIRELISTEVVYENRFWLPPALQALANWISDKRELAAKGIKEALIRDDSKSSMFLALISRRFNRNDATTQWLTRYFQCQHPSDLNRDVVVMINGMASGVFGAAALRSCIAVCRQWFEELELEPGFREGQVKRWMESLDEVAPAVEAEEYATLRKFSPDWPRWEQALSRSRRHAVILEFLQETFEGDLRIPPRLNEAVDDLLASLVGDHHAEELPSYREIERLKCIIETHGDEDTAKALMSQRDPAYDAKPDFATLLGTMAMYPEQVKATEGAQRYALALSKHFFLEGCDQLTGRDRLNQPSSIELQINGWTGTTEDGSEQSALEDSIRTKWDTEAEIEAGKVQFSPVTFLAILGGAAIYYWSGLTSLFGIIVMLAAVGFFFFQRRKVEQQKSQICKQFAEQHDQAINVLRACLAEVADLRREITKEDARAREVGEFMETISPEQYVGQLERATRNVMAA
jgi:hypothetical protein